jgi:hypothetical protein
MTATVQQVPHILISELGLEPAAIALLPSKARRSLIAYLIRWGHQGEAHDCLQAILQAHEPQVSVYDDLARLYLQMGAAQRAQETMRRRQELKRSNSSAALEARTHLAAGDLAAAQAIAQTLAVEAPDMLLTWSLQVDVCLAGADLEGAEAALARGEALQPENVATAQGLARLWATRGDGEKALLWARTAVSRANPMAANLPSICYACWKVCTAPQGRLPRQRPSPPSCAPARRASGRRYAWPWTPLLPQRQPPRRGRRPTARRSRPPSRSWSRLRKRAGCWRPCGSISGTPSSVPARRRPSPPCSGAKACWR